MEKEILTKKIRRLSRISLYLMLIYAVLNISGVLPTYKSYMLYTKEHDLAENIIGFVCFITVLFTALAGFITAVILLNELSRRCTPFTNKISRLAGNMGIYLIILEIAKTIFIYIVSREIVIGLFWLAGIVLYAFSLVFRYGKKLQKLSDETL